MADRPPSPQKLERFGSVGSNGRHDGLRQRAQEQLAHASNTANTANTADNTVVGAKHLDRFAVGADTATNTAGGDPANIAGDPTAMTGAGGSNKADKGAVVDPANTAVVDTAAMIGAGGSNKADKGGVGGSDKAGPSTAKDDHMHDEPEMEYLSKALAEIKDLKDLELDFTPDILVARYKWYKREYKSTITSENSDRLHDESARTSEDSDRPDVDGLPRTSGKSLRWSSEKAPEEEQKPLLDMSDAELAARKKKQRERLKDRDNERQKGLLEHRLRDDEKARERIGERTKIKEDAREGIKREGIERVGEIFKETSIAEVLEAMKNDVKSRNLYIEHVINHLVNNVFLVNTENEKRLLRKRVEKAFFDEHGENAQNIVRLVAALDRRDKSKKAGTIWKIYSDSKFWERRDIRTLKKQVTLALDALELRIRKIENKYLPGELEGGHRHARELSHWKGLMSIRYLHREGTNEIEYAQGRIWSEIHELESDLAEKWALPDVYGERLLKNRGFALQSAKDAFRDKVGLDFKRLDALDVRRQETQLEKQIAKHGSHPTWATMMMSITIGSLVVAVGSVPLAGYAVYLGLHPVPPPPA